MSKCAVIVVLTWLMPSNHESCWNRSSVFPKLFHSQQNHCYRSRARPSISLTMAPVPLDLDIRWQSVAIAVGHVIASIILTGFVGCSLYRSIRGLGPSQDTRKRRAQRAKLIPVFAGLAVISLGSAIYSTLQHLALSFLVWASQRGFEIPAR